MRRNRFAAFTSTYSRSLAALPLANWATTLRTVGPKPLPWASTTSGRNAIPSTLEFSLGVSVLPLEFLVLAPHYGYIAHIFPKKVCCEARRHGKVYRRKLGAAPMS